ncbi:TonB-dependent siderophore receptor [Azohydromonas aeria]|uniref:TonB-dependent siderophore receptor n=1 Tax=Azohydromonas aeria TaxID=2590212 RepID=UPI0012F7FE4F|nr:TonB-dependent siderophore receptor [Azohydromonas aeria]
MFIQLQRADGFKLAVLALASVLAIDASAQDPAADTPDAQLQSVVVRAGKDTVSRYVGASSTAAARLPADPMDLPVAGTSIPRAVIEDQGVLRPADAVRNVSAVTRNPAYLGLTDTYRIRGFQADMGLWNGFRRNFYSSFTDTVHIERIEVIKGAASVTYGDLEPGGVVNYVTKRPTRKPVSSVAMTAGSYGLVRPEFDLGWSSADDGALRMRLTGAHEQADSFRDHVDSRHDTLGLAVDWDLTPRTRVELSAYRLDSRNTPDRGFFNSMGPVVLKLPRERFLGEPRDRYDFEQTDLSALVSHRLTDAVTLRAGVNIYRVDDVRDNVQHRNLQPDGRTLRRQYTFVTSDYKYTTTFAEVRADAVTGALRHTLVAGAERIDRDEGYNFRRDRSSSYAIDIYAPVYGQYARPLGPNDRNRTDVRSDGLYVQDLVSIGEHWRLLAGLRHSRFEQRDVAIDGETDTRFSESETTPRLGVLYRWTPTSSVFASLGRSFAPQSANYSSLAPGVSPAPERGKQWELGYKYTAEDDSVVAGVTAFEIRKQNVAVPVIVDDTEKNRLSGEQTVRGIEFDTSFRLDKQTSVIASYAWLDAFVSIGDAPSQGDRLVNTPRHQGSLWVRHDIAAVPGLGLGVGAFAVGRREAELPNSWTLPSYVRLDASAYWKPQGAAWDLAVHVKNVLDKTYHDSQGNLTYPGAPRSLLATVRWKF